MTRHDAPGSHAIELELIAACPSEIDVGTPFRLRLHATCPSGCEVGAPPVLVELQGRRHDSSAEPILDDAGRPVGIEIRTRAPRDPGEYALRVVVPRNEAEGLTHGEASLTVRFLARPHVTSMAVWGVPSPVVTGASFSVRVGVKCVAECGLAGGRVVVRDEAGRRVGEGLLGDVPAAGTSALHPADVELAAPDGEGLVSWSAGFAGSGRRQLPHGGCSARFGFRVTAPPEHRVRVRVVEAATNRPIGRVDVRVGAHMSTTNEDGVAAIDLPGGVFDMAACRAGWEFSSRKVEVSADLELEMEAVPAPDPAGDEDQIWM